MTRRLAASRVAVLFVALSFVLPAGVARAGTIVVYDDQLGPGFQDWSWATHDLAATSPVHAGTYSISMVVKNWEGLYFHRATPIGRSLVDTLTLWVHGSASGGQHLAVALYGSGGMLGSVPLESFLPGGAVPGNSWARAAIPLGAITADTSFDGVVLQANTSLNEGTVYLDDLVLGQGASVAGPDTVHVTVDPRLDRHVVSPLVYGVNLGSSAEFADLPYPARRWGGNSTTRYSWLYDTSNRGSDWFFMNVPEPNAAPALLPHGSAADVFVSETRAAGAEPLMTVPTIGWAPKARTTTWGFSVAKYGAQTATECTATGNAPWCHADAGNGVSSATGTHITTNDPLDTSTPVGTSFATEWLQHLAGQFGHAGAGGVRYFALDNEPMLWNATHRDVHAVAVTYDELWQRTVDYAEAIKATEPAAQVLGPVAWGWCDYFHSAADGCVAGADQAAHGGTPLLAWYLDQVRARQLTTGVRPVDVLDIHYYPQASGVYGDDEGPGTAALRLRSLKSLYDSTYVDESWIGVPVNLIPRMKQLIAAHCPGMGLAISEYSFGGVYDGDGITSALAQAEALAIFGREGVDIAARWVAPAAGTRVQDAFRMYLDYDRAGGAVTGTSVRAVSGDVDRVGAYAIENDDGRLFVLLFNKQATAVHAELALADGLGGPVSLHRFTATSALGAAGTADGSSGRVDLLLPPYSATLAVVARAGATAVPPAGAGAPGALWLSVRPNPVRGEATLSFVLPAPGRATLAIHDVAGRLLRTLVDGERPAGPQRVTWDGTDAVGRPLASGAYHCRLSAGGRAETRCLVRLR